MFQPYDTGLITDTDADHRSRRPASLGGDDFAYGLGSPIISPGAGVVDLVDTDPGGSGGRMIGVRHSLGVRSEQLHLSGFTARYGQEIAQGERIGRSGGSAFGSEHGVGYHIHAHFVINGIRWGWLNYLNHLGAVASLGITPIQEIDMSGATHLKSPIGETLVIDGIVAVGENTPAEFAALTGAQTVGLSAAMHRAFLIASARRDGLPLVCFIDDGHGGREAGVYIREGGKMSPLADIKTLEQILALGAAHITITRTELDAWIKG